MKKLWKKLLAITAVSLTISLAGLVVSGPVFCFGPPQCVDNKNGTVTDNTTGLMWQRATDGLMNWDAAMIHASNMLLGGLSGWRLPSKDELVGLYNSECKKNMDVKGAAYWSATIDASVTENPWVVHFYNGLVAYGNKSYSYYARAVRTAQ